MFFKEFKVNLYFLAIITAVVIWGFSFIATKIAFRTLPPFTLGAMRFLFTSLLLGIILRWNRGFISIKRNDRTLMYISGVLGITIYFSMENIGVKYATAADAALIISAYPAITLLLEVVFYRVAVPWLGFAGVGIAIAGVYLIVNESSNIGGVHRLTGDIILVAAGIVWSAYNFITRKIVNRYPTMIITFYQSVTGTIAFIPLAYTEHNLWKTPDTESLLAFFYLGLFCSVIAFLLYAYGLKNTAPGSAVMLMNLVPVIGVLFSIVILHEQVSSLQLFGGLIVITGIIIGLFYTYDNNDIGEQEVE